ncbi:MAG: hypothetical protein JWQ72_3731 [Polaromonas sp.]|nr:hypothetical protein [Polaromonas sp.]
MTSFVHLEYSKQHPGVERVTSAFESAQQMRQGFSGARSLATLLVSAFAAAVMVVAYKVMDSIAEGHLMVIWLGMWLVAFAFLASFAGSARQLALRIKASLDAWSRSLAEARADERLWSLAKTDGRVMADLQTAQTRSEFVRPEAVVAKRPARNVQAGGAVLRAYQRNYI